MTQTEALRMALEALWTCSEGDYSTGYVIHPSFDEVAVEKAIHAIKEALAQPEHEWVCGECVKCGQSIEQPAQELSGLPMVISGAIYDFAGYLTTRDKVIEVGSTANASPMADLVKAWAELRGLSLDDAAVLSWQDWLKHVPASDTSQKRVDETAKQRHEQEPVATLWQHGETGRTRITMPDDITDCDARWFKAADLYTTPPQRKPLTDEEILAVARDHYNPHQRSEVSFARAIEAAHGIKGEV